MTLIECQSPLETGSWGSGIPCRREEELNEASSAKSSLSLPQRCLLGKCPPPFKTSFPFEEHYSPTASCHSFPVPANPAPGPPPARYQLISIPEGTLPTPQGEGKHSSASLSSGRTPELPLPGGWRTGLQTLGWLLINTFPTKDFV